MNRNTGIKRRMGSYGRERPCALPPENRIQERLLRQTFLYENTNIMNNYSRRLRNCPVALPGQAAISSGVPAATICPPASPPSGPRSIT